MFPNLLLKGQLRTTGVYLSGRRLVAFLEMPGMEGGGAGLSDPLYTKKLKRPKPNWTCQNGMSCRSDAEQARRKY